MSNRQSGSGLSTLGLAPPAPMGEANFAVVQTVWARLFMEALRRAGITHAVISPGSRSTPFALAAEHAGLTTHTVIDERAAGFFALGCARATGEPALLICTSGSAGAHYYPAVIEAGEAGLPLVIVTADRPPELQACAAPQTIDQSKLFSDRARWFCDLGVADASRGSLRGLYRKAVQAVHRARWPVPGPVHINAPARKPLEPARPESAADIAITRRADEILASVHTRAVAAPALVGDDTIEGLVQACSAAERGLIVAGPCHPGTGLAAAAYDLARITGFPVLAEAAGQLRFAAAATHAGSAGQTAHVIDGFDVLLGSERFRRLVRPELIIQIGPPPISGAWEAYVADNPDCVRCVIAAHGWNDPQSQADMLVLAEPVDTLRRLASALSTRGLAHSRERSLWAERLRAGNELVWRAVDACLQSAEPAAVGAGQPLMREGQAMRAAIAALPRGTLLGLGNGFPVRTVDTYCRAGSAVLDVMSQRGANGIDGLIAGAAGAARTSRPLRPVAMILGDVSFVHDLGGLQAAVGCRSPLLIIVIDNAGGRIFESLPLARAQYGTSPELFTAHWLTPPHCDIEAAARVFGHGYARATTPAELAAAVAQAGRRAGCTIIHAAVEPTSASTDRKRIASELEAALEAGGAALPDQPGASTENRP